MSDEWSQYVRVIRADGTVRQVPLGAWNSGLAQRVLEAGGRFELPGETRGKRVEKTVKLLGRGVEDQMRVGVLLAVPHALQDEDLETVERFAERLEAGRSLTKSQSAKLDEIYDRLEEVDEDGDWGLGDNEEQGENLDRFWVKDSGRCRLWKPRTESVEWSILAKL